MEMIELIQTGREGGRHMAPRALSSNVQAVGATPDHERNLRVDGSG